MRANDKIVTTHWSLTDSEFRKQFSECTFHPDLFSHEAHLRIAWILINELGIKEAVNEIRKQLQNFAKHHNGMDKYHDTVTIAAVKIMSHYMNLSATTNFESYIEENSELITNFKGLLESHYSFNVFVSEKAKKTYIEPDLCLFS